MNRNTLALIVFAAVAVTACTSRPEKARYTVDEYLADAALRREQITKCKNDPGSLGQTPDCINAMEADVRDFRKGRAKRLQPNPLEIPTKGPTEP